MAAPICDPWGATTVTSLAHRMGAALDRAIGVFSPATEQRRLLRRVWNVNYERSQYAAAKVSRLGGNWTPVNESPNEVIAASLPQLRARVRQLVRDFPYFARAVRVLTDLTVGNGHQFQARIKGRDGKPDQRLNDEIEERWSRFVEEADITGQQTLHELSRLAKRQDVECGEFLLVYVHDGPRLRLQMYEPDWLSDLVERAQGGNEIEQGVEYDPRSGRPVAYHLSAPWTAGGVSRPYRALRLPAEDVLHRFEVLRPGQMRGVSILVSAILLAHDLGEFLDAELDAAKAAASWVGYVKSNQWGQRQKLHGVKKDSLTGKPFENVRNAMLEWLGPQDEMKLFTHDRPSGLDVAHKVILRALAVVAGLSYEFISGDYDKVSYSNVRGIRIDLNNQMTPHKARHDRDFYSPIYQRWLDNEVLSGGLHIPDYFRRRWYYQRAHEFIPPVLEDVDPLRTSKAHNDEINSYTRSPQEVIRARGGDPDTVLGDIAAWRKKVTEEHGLPLPGAPSTPLKQNPAALGAKE